MWFEKLRNGFVQVLTASGSRYVRPSRFETLRLLWIFRNFSILSLKVLTPGQQRFVTGLCSEKRMFQSWEPNEQLRCHLIGILMDSCLPR
jgi:hypothetical protein